MTQGQQDELSTRYKCIIKTFDPASPSLQSAIARRPALAVNLAKLWLDQLFPEFDVIIFLDADTWVQDWRAIHLLAGAAEEGALAVVPSWNRYRGVIAPIMWVFGFWPQVRTFNIKAAYLAGLSWKIQKQISLRGDLNAGVYALKRDAIHWDRMRHWQEIILKRGRPFTSDGLAMALATHVDGCPLQLMPAFCNFVEPWLYDTEKKALVDVYFPHDPVGIVHLANQKTIRFDRHAQIPVPCTDGATRHLNIRYGLLPGHVGFEDDSLVPDVGDAA